MMMLHFPVIVEGGVDNMEFSKNQLEVCKMTHYLLGDWLRHHDKQRLAPPGALPLAEKIWKGRMGGVGGAR